MLYWFYLWSWATVYYTIFITFQNTRTAFIKRSTNDLGNYWESWRPLLANTRASTRLTSSVQLEPSSPQSKVSYDHQLSFRHAHISPCFSVKLPSYSSTLPLVCFLSLLICHPSLHTFLSRTFTISTVLSHSCFQGLEKVITGERFWSFLRASKHFSSSEITQVHRACVIQPHTECKKIIFWSQIPDLRGREKRVPFVLCLTVHRELHWGILFNLSFNEIMIWHAGQFLTWLPHKNPPSIPRLNLHCKEDAEGLHSFLNCLVSMKWWHGELNKVCDVNAVWA